MSTYDWRRPSEPPAGTLPQALWCSAHGAFDAVPCPGCLTAGTVVIRDGAGGAR